MRALAGTLLLGTALAMLAGGAVPALAKTGAKTSATRDADDPISVASRAAQQRDVQKRETGAKPVASRTTRSPSDSIEDDDDNASPQLEAVHVVLAGETLGGVANRAHVPRVLIIEANGLKEPYVLREGQRLRLPRTRHHTVAKGDARIAKPAGDGAKAVAGGPVTAGKNAGAATSGTQAAALTAKIDPDARFVWPTVGKVVRRFTARGTPNYHDGIDIAGQSGAAVRASAGGDVVFAGQEPESFGRLVLINHKNGWQTAYGFLGKITVAQGDHVRVGERIGLVGHSGKATRDELHFELRRANRPVDPVPQMVDAPGKALAAKSAGE